MTPLEEVVGFSTSQELIGAVSDVMGIGIKRGLNNWQSIVFAWMVLTMYVAMSERDDKDDVVDLLHRLMKDAHKDMSKFVTSKAH